MSADTRSCTDIHNTALMSQRPVFIALMSLFTQCSSVFISGGVYVHSMQFCFHLWWSVCSLNEVLFSSLVECMYLVFTRMPCESYRRQLNQVFAVALVCHLSSANRPLSLKSPCMDNGLAYTICQKCQLSCWPSA